MSQARSVWFVGPRRVELRTSDVPVIGEGEVAVKTTFSGISAGTELLAYRGLLDPDMPLDETIGALGGTFTYPFQYGYSCVGVVENSRAQLAVGTQVFAFAPHQERFVARAADVVPVPGVDGRVATMLPLVETALQIALDSGSVLQETVVILGGGAVGLLTALVLQRAGARVIVVEPRGTRRVLADRLGIEATDTESVVGGVALVIEASGNPDAPAFGLELLAHEGTLLVASWYGTQAVMLPLGSRFHRRRLTIRSTQVSTIPARLSDRWDRSRRLEAAVALLQELPLRDLGTHTFPFGDAPAAFRAVDEGTDGLLHAALGY